MQVAFVVCPSFQGATLLALLLNNHSQVSALGDMLPWRGVNQMCACGQRVSECDFWTTVSEGVDTSAFSEGRTLLPVMPWPLSHHQFEASVVPVSRDARLNRTVGRVAGRLVDLAAPAAWRLRRRSLLDFVGAYESFYRRILEIHGTSTFVDGYKSWRKAALLSQELQPANDVKIIHLVRDPRGFAASRRRHADADDLRESAWIWADLHHRMESLRQAAPYYLIRYEDLSARPDFEMRALLQFLQVEPETVVSPPRYPRKHHVLGNQMLRTFSGRVALDERWRTELSTDEQGTVLRCAGGLADRLGYGDATE
jgi:Sulfotransferase domain